MTIKLKMFQKRFHSLLLLLFRVEHFVNDKRVYQLIAKFERRMRSFSRKCHRSGFEPGLSWKFRSKSVNKFLQYTRSVPMDRQRKRFRWAHFSVSLSFFLLLRLFLPCMYSSCLSFSLFVIFSFSFSLILSLYHGQHILSLPVTYSLSLFLTSNMIFLSFSLTNVTHISLCLSFCLSVSHLHSSLNRISSKTL